MSRDTDKIVSLRGANVACAAQPNKELIETLEAHLARARSGEIVAAAYVIVLGDEEMETGWDDTHPAITKYTLCAGANILASRLNSQAD